MMMKKKKQIRKMATKVMIIKTMYILKIFINTAAYQKLKKVLKTSPTYK